MHRSLQGSMRHPSTMGIFKSISAQPDKISSELRQRPAHAQVQTGCMASLTCLVLMPDPNLGTNSSSTCKLHAVVLTHTNVAIRVRYVTSIAV